MNRFSSTKYFVIAFIIFVLISCNNSSRNNDKRSTEFYPTFKLTASQKFYFNNFVDCNMAEAWIADTFRIFPGKYGEDTVWGAGKDLKFASGKNADEAFLSPASKFTEPRMPANAAIGSPGLHGAVWFETIYQDNKDSSGKSLYAIYHNENYPENFPYNPATGKGYKKENWPEGLRGPSSSAAVCRIPLCTMKKILMPIRNGADSASVLPALY